MPGLLQTPGMSLPPEKWVATRTHIPLQELSSSSETSTSTVEKNYALSSQGRNLICTNTQSAENRQASFDW